jgi:hypothetical protein
MTETDYCQLFEWLKLIIFELILSFRRLSKIFGQDDVINRSLADFVYQDWSDCEH